MTLKPLLTAILLLTLGVHAFSQFNDISLKNKGAIFQLSVWKSAIENVASQKINDATISKSDKINISKNYQVLKAQVEGAVLQLRYEINNKNKLAKKFNQINCAFLNDQFETTTYKYIQLNAFVSEIKDYFRNAKLFLLDPITLSNNKKIGHPRMPAAPISIDLSSISPIDFIGSGWTIYKDIKDLQGNRAEGLAALLSEVTLANLNDLKK
ncbi:hypothetical protein [Segetibacter koreensis]|uniref:hypothetical protein n=1 Tax=Segetibacter koreensis TaxID=398037 RepID=UPI0003740FCF|nr:hypothetical protein [Segetibacter koreensis]